jgi:hypothetical protein
VHFLGRSKIIQVFNIVDEIGSQIDTNEWEMNNDRFVLITRKCNLAGSEAFQALMAGNRRRYPSKASMKSLYPYVTVDNCIAIHFINDFDSLYLFIRYWDQRNSDVLRARFSLLPEIDPFKP